MKLQAIVIGVATLAGACMPLDQRVSNVAASNVETTTPSDSHESRVAPSPAPPTLVAHREPDVIFIPTPMAVVAAMLDLAAVGPSDVVYDLGCGDGRIAIAAVKDFGAKKAVCVDIDPERVREARANARAAGVADRVEVRQGDLFETELSEATVVTLYLLDRLNLKLRPKLHAELRPGARVVSQTFGMGSWEPDETIAVEDKVVYLWTIRDESARR